MKRRAFLKLSALAACAWPVDATALIRLIKADKQKVFKIQDRQDQPEQFSNTHAFPVQRIGDASIKDYLTKIRNPDINYKDDVIVEGQERQMLAGTVERLQKIYRTIGHGNFGVLGFDEAIRFARNLNSIGAFSKSELRFLESMYYWDASEYGFFGEKQIVGLTQKIDKKDIHKVPYTGNYLFKGESLAKYRKIKNDLGNDALLTSGIRGLVKQFYLFLNKANHYGGNLSLASRSLAPPGYSYHATGDFDIGQMGFGEYNFSERFISTPVYKKLAAQGYVEYRYRKDNMLGVRYEPWHIKLVALS